MRRICAGNGALVIKARRKVRMSIFKVHVSPTFTIYIHIFLDSVRGPTLTKLNLPYLLLFSFTLNRIAAATCFKSFKSLHGRNKNMPACTKK